MPGFEKGVERFLGCIRDHSHILMARLILETGCSVSELVRIQKKDVDLDSRCLKLPGRTAAISNELCRIFTKICPKAGLLFGNGKSGISPRRAQQIFAAYSGLSGLKITPRTLRRVYQHRKMIECADSCELQKKTGLKNVQKIQKAEFDLSCLQDAREKVIIGVISETGMKTSKLLQLKISSICGRSIYHDGRSYPISRRLGCILSGFTKGKDNKGYVFQGKNEVLSARRIQQIMAAASIRSGQKLRPGDLRKNFALKKHDEGHSPGEITHFLGISRLDASTYGTLNVGWKK